MLRIETSTKIKLLFWRLISWLAGLLWGGLSHSSGHLKSRLLDNVIVTRKGGIIVASGNMNLIDDLSAIIKTTPLTGIDWQFLKRMDPTKISDRIDYGFSNIMLEAFRMSTKAGVSEEVALGAVLQSHED